MNRLALALSTIALAVPACPASAVVLGATDVSLGSTPTVFDFGAGGFAFTYDAAAAATFSDPYSVQTLGTGQTSAFGGFLGIPLEPSPFDTRGITIDGDLFPSFAAFPTLSVIPYSIVQEDLALRYAVGSDFYYGFARLNGDGTLNIGFENQANTAITAGAAITGALPAPVPEPATWATMLLGFACVGFAIRRKRTSLAMA